ncbi:amino acid ABC transporter substrate-binding protein [Treponema sp. UBA7567]|uniref:amino acid ABC transporter substrate-binding protein n=1 Tax=Treponema sp. UBA7567 TaxID=1947748 RepID=UPI0025F507B4|nr:amino acid ABC transporter substrate-binding protein [Treponema sp. UBA7567]
MKKITLFVCAFAALTVFAGCSKKEAGDNSLEALKSRGEFILGLDDSFPPLGFRDSSNEIVGFDIDLAKEVASRLGVKFRAQPINWDSKEQELATGNIDCIWNGLTITEERKAALSFSKPYLKNAQVLVVKKNSGIKKLSDMAGKKVGIQAGSSASDAVEASPDFKRSVKSIIEFKDNIMALNDLEIGGVDGVVMDLIVANYAIKTSGKPFEVLSEGLAPEEYGIAFRKGDVKLTDEVQKILEAMAADGTVTKISEKWFGSDITVIGK